MSTSPSFPPLSPDSIAATSAFIEAHWQETVRFQTEDQGTLIGLPYRYTIPSRNHSFQELYYWDTYFTSVGLLHGGQADLATDNARNLLAQLHRYGYVPNGNRTFYLTRSQPPFLGPLVREVAAATGDAEFLREGLEGMRREYAFWIGQRSTPTGLARYGYQADDGALIAFFPEIADRTGIDGKAEDHLPQIAHIMAECESGWDFNPRFDRRCLDFCPVDLNANLYLYETFLADHSEGTEKTVWLEKARLRRERVTALCWNREKGAFFDYDYKNRRQGDVVAASALQTLWTGLATPEQAGLLVEKLLPQLEFPRGLAACARGPRVRLSQWDYPNGWACLYLIAYRGLQRYGYRTEARRIAAKYVAAVAQGFAETGELWEKYNVESGSPRTANEAGYLHTSAGIFEGKPATPEAHKEEELPPAMMGWTAGVFLDAAAYLRESGGYGA